MHSLLRFCKQSRLIYLHCCTKTSRTKQSIINKFHICTPTPHHNDVIRHRVITWISSSASAITRHPQQQRTASTSIQGEQPTITNSISGCSVGANSSTNSQQSRKLSTIKTMMIRPIIITGPSGGGKSTILAKAMKEHPDTFAFSISHTTRKPRPGEHEGEHYHFVERDEMERMIEAGKFYEHAQFGGNLYGTSKKAVADICRSGKICVLDVELQGVHNFKNSKFDAKYILIKPPSMDVLEKRLRQRGTETEQSIAKRLKHAQEDLDAVIKEPTLYDCVITNDQLEKAYGEFLDAIKEQLDAFKKKAAQQNNNHINHP